VRTHYELLGVAPAAPADEIKRAFRREIAKYHPDKVQHLGAEFQEIAASKAAELTQAYKTLTDAGLRAEYDAAVAAGMPAPAHPAEPPPPAVADVPEAPRPAEEPHPAAPPTSSAADAERTGVSEFIRRATLARFRTAVETEIGTCQTPTIAGFDVTCVPKTTFWKKTPPSVLGRFVARVDGPALTETWGLASKVKFEGVTEVCVFLMGAAMAPAGELASAVADQRRKARPEALRVTVVPVSTSNWQAHIPNDAPPVVKSVLARLKG
jgi:hypothetical protein